MRPASLPRPSRRAMLATAGGTAGSLVAVLLAGQLPGGQRSLELPLGAQPPSAGASAASPTGRGSTVTEVLVPVGTDLQQQVDAHPPGTTFRLLPGIHREQAVRPKDRDVFVGAPGAVLSGARIVRDFAREDGFWYAAGQEQQREPHGECADAAPLCVRPETVFLDGQRARPVGSRNELEPGAYYFDYDADRIWFGTDPRASFVETAVTGRAFSGDADGVVIRELVVEKYANRAQTGAVDAGAGTGWVVERVTSRLNAGGGLRAGPRTRITASRALDNGQIGVVGTGEGIVVVDTEIAGNNTSGFAAGWEAGGTKFSRTDGLVVRRCSVHDNRGHGLWTDVDNVRTKYEGNEVIGNSGEGIFHEISGSALIRDNVVRDNGSGFSLWVFGAGIHIASSFDVKVHDNVVENNANGIVGSQQDRGTGPNGRRRLANLHVQANTIRSSGRVGVAQDIGDRSVFRSWNNRFTGNNYPQDQVFVWDDRELDLRQWQAEGHDRVSDGDRGR